MGYDGGSVIATETMEWRPLAPGVSIKVLRLDRATGAWTVMINSEPGSVLPRHQHLGVSEIYILRGAGHHPETGDFKAGDYVLEADGAVHSPLHFDQQVTQIMVSHGPSAFLNDDDSVAFVMDTDMLMGFVDDATIITGDAA